MAMTSETRVTSSFVLFVLIIYHKLLVLGIFKSTVNDIHVFHTGNPSPDVTTDAKRAHSFILIHNAEQCSSCYRKQAQSKCEFLNKSTLQVGPASHELDGKPAFMNDSSLETADGLLKVPRPAPPARVPYNTRRLWVGHTLLACKSKRSGNR